MTTETIKLAGFMFLFVGFEGDKKVFKMLPVQKRSPFATEKPKPLPEEKENKEKPQKKD